MAKLKIAAIGAFLVQGISLSQACTCDWQGPFVQMAGLDGAIVVIGTVREHIDVSVSEGPFAHPKVPQAMVFRVEEVMRGAIEMGEIVVWGDNGFMCRPSVSHFPIGSRWALILFRGEQDFFISVCGEFWLREEEGRFSGAFSTRRRNHVQRVTIEKMRKKIGEKRTE